MTTGASTLNIAARNAGYTDKVAKMRRDRTNVLVVETNKKLSAKGFRTGK